MKRLLALCLLLLPAAALAAPTDLDLQTQRAAAAEQENRYLIMLLDRQKAVDEATAAWWAEVWKALPMKEDAPK
jgi:hypothetical protein